MKEKCTVLIADDHPITRAGLATMLKSAGIKVVGEAANGEEAVANTLKLKPDVVLMDVRMPKKTGVEALAAIRRKAPGQRVILLSAFDDRVFISEAIRHGAADYLSKASSAAEIVSAIHRVRNDEPLPEESLLHKVRRLNRRSRPRAKNDCPLTNRELQVLRNVALGLSNREIGVALEISIETVKEHVQNALRKLDVAGRTQAAVLAINNGWV